MLELYLVVYKIRCNGCGSFNNSCKQIIKYGLGIDLTPVEQKIKSFSAGWKWCASGYNVATMINEKAAAPCQPPFLFCCHTYLLARKYVYTTALQLDPSPLQWHLSAAPLQQIFQKSCCSQDLLRDCTHTITTVSTTCVCVLKTNRGPTGNSWERTRKCNEQTHSSLTKSVLLLSLEYRWLQGCWWRCLYRGGPAHPIGF